MSERSYGVLSTYLTYEERVEYLRLFEKVGSDTFGFDRVFNQMFYKSPEWKRVRREVILRDNGCDLGLPDRPIVGKIYVHHMNPITMDDLKESNRVLLEPSFLVCVSMDTHNLIHFGTDSVSKSTFVKRTKNDTCPWKK